VTRRNRPSVAVRRPFPYTTPLEHRDPHPALGKEIRAADANYAATYYERVVFSP
jgi:hypothetical protein